MGYDLQGRMHEVCSCQTQCPCWNGLDPDGGTCRFSWIFHVDRGQVNDVDVTGLNMGFLGHLPGNVFDGNVRLEVLVDDRCDVAQQEALVAAFTGQVGGPLADLAGLVGEIVAVGRSAFEFDVDQGTGRFSAGDRFAGEVTAYRSPTGTPTTMHDTALAPVLGSPAYPAKVVSFRMDDHGHDLAFTPGGATQAEFHYSCA